MLYWTCPECGRECPPTARECPTCPPRSIAQPTTDSTVRPAQANCGILALSHNLETIQVLAPAVPSIDVKQAVENGNAPHGSGTATVIEETPNAGSNGLPADLVVEHEATPAEEALAVLAEETLAIPVQQAVDSLVRQLVESVERETEMPSNGAAAHAEATTLEIIPEPAEEQAATSVSETES